MTMLKTTKVVMNAVLRMATAQGMTQPERIALFVDKDKSRNRLFIELAKLFRAIESGLTGKQKIFPMLEKAGVKKGSVSNASLASKVFDLVTAEKITEDEFDSLTWADCVAIIRVMSAQSKKRLTADEAAVYVKTKADFEPDLAELYATGLTLAEKVEADKVAAKLEEKTKADAKKAEIKAAAELKAVQDENAKLAKQVAANAPPQTPVEVPNETPIVTAAATPPPTPTVTPPIVAAPTNIVPLPAAPKKRTAADMIATLDSVFSDMADLDADEQAVVARKLIELADIITSTGSHLDAAQRAAA